MIGASHHEYTMSVNESRDTAGTNVDASPGRHGDGLAFFVAEPHPGQVHNGVTDVSLVCKGSVAATQSRSDHKGCGVGSSNTRACLAGHEVGSEEAASCPRWQWRRMTLSIE